MGNLSKFTEATRDFEGENREASLDQKLASWMLAFYSVRSAKPAVAAVSRHGGGQVTLDSFIRYFDFPMYLTTAWVPYLLSDIPTVSLFNNFPSRKLVKAFDANLEEIPQEYAEHPFGIIVQLKGISRGLVLHDWQYNDFEESPEGLKKPCVRMVWTRKKGNQSEVPGFLVLEPFEQMLRSIRWSPPNVGKD